MPPKRTSDKNTTASESQEAVNSKRAKQRNVPEKPSLNDDDGKPHAVDEAEKKYMLGREIASLRSRLKKAKKELVAFRTTQKDVEFEALRDSSRLEEKFPEFAKNVEMWSKYTGAKLDHASFSKGKDSREWILQGSVEGIQFEMRVTCATDEHTRKGYVQKFSIKFPKEQDVLDEIQPWLSTNEGNIEQIFKMLKAFGEMHKIRRDGLEECKAEFGDTLSFSRGEAGEMVVDLGTEASLFFQIKWKITTSAKHYARVKNVCRIACTEDGDKYIRQHADLAVIKKRLSQAPIEVIQMLARGIAGGQK